MPAPDITNNKLAKLLSFEFITWACGGILAAGMAYQAIASDIEKASESVHDVKAQQSIFMNDISAIKVSQATTAASQISQAGAIADLKRGQHRILDILERRYGKD